MSSVISTHSTAVFQAEIYTEGTKFRSTRMQDVSYMHIPLRLQGHLVQGVIFSTKGKREKRKKKKKE